MSHEVWGGTRNGDHHFGKQYLEAQLGAAGFDRRHSAGQPRFNGGMVAHREVRLVAGQKLYRFCSSKVTKLQDQACGHWWFDEDMCILLWSVSDGSDASFRRAARTMFAVLPEWNDMNFCVSGRLKSDHWAIRGTTAKASGVGGSYGNHHGQEARQLFVPGKLDHEAFSQLRPVGLTRAVY